MKRIKYKAEIYELKTNKSKEKLTKLKTIFLEKRSKIYDLAARLNKKKKKVTNTGFVSVLITADSLGTEILLKEYYK